MLMWTTIKKLFFGAVAWVKQNAGAVVLFTAALIVFIVLVVPLLRRFVRPKPAVGGGVGDMQRSEAAQAEKLRDTNEQLKSDAKEIGTTLKKIENLARKNGNETTADIIGDWDSWLLDAS